MSKLRSFIVYWLPVLLVMIMIFGGSADAASGPHSSRIVGPLLRWLFPDISKEGMDLGVLLARKCAHLTEYAVLALLIWRALRQPRRGLNPTWLWCTAGEALWLAVFYASTDEFHQTFVPTREGCVRDVIIDTSGATAGLLALWVLGRLIKWW